MKPTPLTVNERKAIEALHRVAEMWPRSLWLFSANGSLCVMKCNKDGEHAMSGEGVDQNFKVDRINIPNDGGDW